MKSSKNFSWKKIERNYYKKDILNNILKIFFFKLIFKSKRILFINAIIIINLIIFILCEDPKEAIKLKKRELSYSNYIIIDHTWASQIKHVYSAEYTGPKSKVYINNNIQFPYKNGDIYQIYCDSNKINLEVKLVWDAPLTDCSNMFKNCKDLGEVYFQYFDFSLVTNMSSMFMNCESLLSIRGLSNTSSLTDVSFMFYNSHLTDRYFKMFDTPSVTNMSYMFYGFNILHFIINFMNTSSVVDMSYMFSSCGMNTLRLVNLNTSSVINMNNMFSYSQTLGSL